MPGNIGIIASSKITPAFDPLTSFSTSPLHAFYAADSLWTQPADTGSVSTWLNSGSYKYGAFIDTGGLRTIGLTTDYATTPDSSALDITGDITLVADVTAADWTPAAVSSPIGKTDGVGTDASWAITLLTTGYLRLFFTADGTTSLSKDSTVPVSAENGTRLRIGVTLDVDNGAGGHDVKFWTSTDGTTWTQLGSTVTTAGTTSIYSGPDQVWFGRAGVSNVWNGMIHRAKIYSGIHDLNADTGGTLALDANFESATRFAESFTESSSNAATITVVSQARAACIKTSGLALNGNTTTARMDCATIPDVAAMRMTGDMELVVQASATDWTPSGGKVLVLSGDNGAYATINWYLYYNATGTITFARPPGGTARLFTSSVATGIADGATKWIKVTYDQDNGAGNAECKFYLSDDGSSWTQLGTTQTYASTLAGNSNTQGVTIGQSYSGAFGHAGTIRRVIAKDGIDGTTVLDVDFEAATEGAETFTESSSNAATVTIVSSVDPVQATGSKQPTYDASNATYNNKPTVYFTTDDVLGVNIPDIAQPYYIVVVGDTSGAGGSERLVGIGTGTGAGIGDNGSSEFAMNAGTSMYSAIASDTDPHLYVGKYLGTTLSELILDGTVLASSLSGSNNITTISLGAGNSTIGTYAGYLTGDIAYAAIFDTDPTLLPEWSSFESWAESEYTLDVTPAGLSIQVPTLLDSALYSPTNTCTSASITPTADSWLVITCVSGSLPGTFAFSSTTLSGVSSMGAIQQSSGNEKVGILWARLGNSPGTGTITISGFGTPGTTRAAMHVMEVVGGKTIRQTKIGTTTSATPSITLDRTPESSSLVIGTIGLYGVTIPPGANFTELSESNANRALQTQYDLTNATSTVDWSLGASTLCAMAAIEITD